ncbi:SHOCT domain-containing protein [Streptomyces sp. SID625]|nr:SHOCT domain-containing protein [Streptomyces sp. SID625]
MARYEGVGGWVEVGPTTLTVCRTDMRPEPLAPRVLPSRALSGVQLKDATRLRRGRLHLWFGGQVLVPVGSDEDPNTIGFTYGQREAFRTLYDYLWSVVQTNEAQDVDVAAAYQAAGDPLVTWLAERERARKEAEEERAAAEDAAQQERATRLARDIGPQAAARRDIMAAGLASATGERCGSALKALPGLLLGDEQVYVVAECYLGDGSTSTGTVVLTQLRLLFIQSKFTRNEVSALYLKEVRTVASRQKVIKGSLQVETLQGDIVEFNGLKAEDLARLDEALRLAVGNPDRTAPAPPAGVPGASDDVLSQVARLGELHAAGVITTAEFEQKKKQLLDRL